MVKLLIGIALIIGMTAIATPAQQLNDDFIPSGKAHLRGRQLDITLLQNSNSKNKSTTTTDTDGDAKEEPIDIKSIVLEELRRSRKEPEVAQAAKVGILSTFDDMINNIHVSGKFEVLSVYASIPDNYLRTIERTIRGNIYPPIIGRTVQQAVSVAVTFIVQKDGTINQIEKESTTGSTALDSTAISACRSSSPLPMPPAVTNENIVRMRFTLTYIP